MNVETMGEALTVNVQAAGVILGTVATFALVVVAIRSLVTARATRRQQYHSELRFWADESMNVLSKALHLCDLDPVKCANPSFFERRHDMRVQLSALLDRGRWFFPNVDPENYGHHKDLAYQGIRQPALDCLADAYKQVGKMNYLCRRDDKNSKIRCALEKDKRVFASEVQKRLEPRETIYSMRKRL